MLEKNEGETTADYVLRLMEFSEQSIEYRNALTLINNAYEEGDEGDDLEGSVITFSDGSMFTIREGQFEVWNPGGSDAASE